MATFTPCKSMCYSSIGLWFNVKVCQLLSSCNATVTEFLFWFQNTMARHAENCNGQDTTDGENGAPPRRGRGRKRKMRSRKDDDDDSGKLPPSP